MGKPGKKSPSGSSRAATQKRGEETSVGDVDSSEGELIKEQPKTRNDGDPKIASDADCEHADTEFGAENPQTCCSNCQTIFEVSVELLSSSDTRVRCGECLSIFDALSNLRDGEVEEDDILIDADGNVVESLAHPAPSKRHEREDLPESQTYHEVSNLPNAGAAALAGLTNDTSALDVTYSDFDLFSEEADLPEVTYLDQTRDTSNFDFNEFDENDETFSDTLFSEDATVDVRPDSKNPADAHDLQNIALTNDVGYIADESPGEPLIFNYRERETRTSSNDASAVEPVLVPDNEIRQTFTGVDRDVYTGKGHKISLPDHKTSSWLFRGVLLLLVIVLAGGLYLYRERESIYTNTALRPVFESACAIFKCVLPEPSDLTSIKVVKRAVFSHPSIDNALIINLAFVNEASFNQRYPILEIRLEDRSGRLVVKNNFSPADYLNTWQEGDRLDTGKRLDISLTVEDPGNTATSFELDFR